MHIVVSWMPVIAGESLLGAWLGMLLLIKTPTDKKFLLMFL
jgi:hypothetical protein